MDVRTERPVTREELQTMMREEPTIVRKSWKATIGGLLAIITGYLNILAGILAIIGYNTGFLTVFSVGVGTGLGILLLALGIVAVIGGVYAIRRRGWGMALTGSIVSLAPTPAILPGIFSLIFTTLGRPEFKPQSNK